MIDTEMLQAMRQIVKEEIEPIKQDIEFIKQEFEPVRQDVEFIKQEFEPVRQDVEFIKQEFGPVRQDVEFMKQEISSLKKDLAATQMAVLNNGEAINRIEEKVDDLVSVVKTNSFDIARLRNKVS